MQHLRKNMSWAGFSRIHILMIFLKRIWNKQEQLKKIVKKKNWGRERTRWDQCTGVRTRPRGNWVSAVLVQERESPDAELSPRGR